jgi:hypothetical protein
MEPAGNPAVTIAGEPENTEPEAAASEQPATGSPIAMVLAVTGIVLAAIFLPCLVSSAL